MRPEDLILNRRYALGTLTDTGPKVQCWAMFASSFPQWEPHMGGWRMTPPGESGRLLALCAKTNAELRWHADRATLVPPIWHALDRLCAAGEPFTPADLVDPAAPPGAVWVALVDPAEILGDPDQVRQLRQLAAAKHRAPWEEKSGLAQSLIVEALNCAADEIENLVYPHCHPEYAEGVTEAARCIRAGVAIWLQTKDTEVVDR